MKREWVVHPNRSAVVDDEDPCSGRYRSIRRRGLPAKEPFLARVELPSAISHVADPDGAITFGGYDWWFVVGAARTFARTHVNSDVPPPFGFKRNGVWQWWDGSMSATSLLEQPNGEQYVRPYLKRLFPGRGIELINRLRT
ncbi:hypothetical protein [Mycolicibacterium austroafricanum]|uniref:hypothetical protein n=1 Tax=Mycolicibacterium austroafricanum TaxID=39687 RepID=UPI000CF986D1|nr:hypothetical protein [Mycolicibacterium austroafricanum]PQP43860.1 hypothetical protein C6A88_23360 [Mycolicibacterium austroafricanum]